MFNEEEQNLNKQKRYYTSGETVWVKTEHCQGEVLSVDIKKQEVDVQTIDIVKGIVKTLTYKLWEIDKLRIFDGELETLESPINFNKPLTQSTMPTLYFSKLREGAVTPSKRSEDLGHDLYACLTEKHITANGHKELLIPRGTAGMIPTGLAMVVPINWGVSLQHERGSVGTKGIVITAGAGDSGYRDEYFICALPIQYSLLLTTDAEEVEVAGTKEDPVLIYPVSKAIAQAIIIPSPNVSVMELDYEVLKNIPSERGMGKLGSTN